MLGIPYSARTSYNYFDSFLIGLNLDYFFKGSNECIDKVVFTADDFVYLGNNRTLSKSTNGSAWFGPILNFTGILARNMDNVLPNCYLTYGNAKLYAVTQFQQFNNSIGQVLLSFLFNQMGNALQFVTKFNNIEINKQNQNYAGAWLEFGNIVHIIFDFQPLALATRDSAFDQMAKFLVDSNILENEDDAHQALVNLVDSIDEKFASVTSIFNSFFLEKNEEQHFTEKNSQ